MPRHTAPRRAAPIATAVLLAAVLVGGAIVTTRPDGQPRPSGAVEASGPTATAPATAQSPTPSPSRTPDRVSRGQPRATPTPSATRSPTATRNQPVLSSGTCEVSYYDEPQPTASGELFDPEAYTAAHKSLPFNTRVRVTNPANGKSVIVRINDRGPYIDGRCLDLARAPFRDIASLSAGVIAAKYEVLG